MSNRVIKKFKGNSSWVAPANVKSVRAIFYPEVKTFRNNPSRNSQVFLDDMGNAWAVGNNDEGQLGVGDSTSRSSPVAVLGGLTFKKVIISSNNGTGKTVLGLTPQGKAYTWGYNANGQMGDGTVVGKTTPTAVSGSLVFQDIFYNGNAMFALTPKGELYAWGGNTNGQLGVGDVTPRSTPTAVLGGFKFQRISGNSVNVSSIFGITSDGTAYAWGVNTGGVLGVGDVTPRSSPVAVLGGIAFQKIIADGSPKAYGIAIDGTPYGWGLNNQNYLGLNDFTPRSSPVAMLGGFKFQEISHMVNGGQALSTDGEIYSWGTNVNGVHGTGGVAASGSPVKALGGLIFKSYSSSIVNNFIVALTEAGVAYAWGMNANGNLGLGDVVPRSTPVAVLGSLAFAQIEVGPDDSGSFRNVFGVTPGGVAYSWGENTGGALGLGDITPRSSPVAMLGGFAGRTVPETVQQTIAVTPGSTYAITLQNYTSTFGTYAVGKGKGQLVLEYDT